MPASFSQGNPRFVTASMNFPWLSREFESGRKRRNPLKVPLLVIHWRTIDAAVWEEGWRDGQYFRIRSNDTSYVTRPIFTEYVTSVILLYFAATRESFHLQDFTSVLFWDNCSSHIDEGIKQLLADNNIRLVTFPPHTSHLFQPLDLVTFAAFKRERREVHVGRPVGSQVWEITKLMRALERATDSTTNRAAFRRAGLAVNLRNFPPVASVDSRKLNGIIDSSTLPDSSEGDGNSEPSGHQRQTRPLSVFGFLNEANFPGE
jgi:hypothetical protein